MDLHVIRTSYLLFSQNKSWRKKETHGIKNNGKRSLIILRVSFLPDIWCLQHSQILSFWHSDPRYFALWCEVHDIWSSQMHGALFFSSSLHSFPQLVEQSVVFSGHSLSFLLLSAGQGGPWYSILISNSHWAESGENFAVCWFIFTVFRGFILQCCAVLVLCV